MPAIAIAEKPIAPGALKRSANIPSPMGALRLTMSEACRLIPSAWPRLSCGVTSAVKAPVAGCTTADEMPAKSSHTHIHTRANARTQK